jgi:hypothetical protein
MLGEGKVSCIYLNTMLYEPKTTFQELHSRRFVPNNPGGRTCCHRIFGSSTGQLLRFGEQSQVAHYLRISVDGAPILRMRHNL